MAFETKKFLDSAGTSHLWSKIKDELANKVDTVTAGDGVTVSGSGNTRTVGVKVSNKAGNVLSVESGTGEEGLYVPTPAASALYSISKDTTSTDYAAVYHLTKDGVNEGVAINIPKDMVVSSGSVVTKATAGAWGAAGTYIELTLANADNDTLYIAVDDLVEYVTSGSQQTDAVVISVNANHEVTATLTDGSIAATKLSSEVQTALNNANSALQASDITTGATNGTISVDGTDVAVYGLGSAAYASTTDFDASGEAQAAYNAIIGLTNNEIDAAILAANNNSNNG